MIKLLLVEDDANLCYIIQSGLEDMIGGYEVLTAKNGEEGLKVWRKEHPDIIVADIEMPVMNGFEMVAKMRETDGNTPILFASGRISPKDVTAGYKLGGNNYIKKPFVPEEMDAHIKALLKMNQGLKMRNEADIYPIGKYYFDYRHALLTDIVGNTKTITTQEAHILKLLAANKGNIVRRNAIMEECWGKDKSDDYFTSRSLDVFVTRLRNILKDDPNIEIKTMKGVGLMLIDEVQL